MPVCTWCGGLWRACHFYLDRSGQLPFHRRFEEIYLASGIIVYKEQRGEWEGVSMWMETQEGNESEDNQEGRTHSLLQISSNQSSGPEAGPNAQTSAILVLMQKANSGCSSPGRVKATVHFGAVCQLVEPARGLFRLPHQGSKQSPLWWLSWVNAIPKD